jgi:hypothetical protein
VEYICDFLKEESPCQKLACGPRLRPRWLLVERALTC